MNIETIIGRMEPGVTLAAELAYAIEDPLPQPGTGGLDILHIIGGWTPHARSRAKWAKKHFIPVMHTPLGSLSPWMKPSETDIRLSEQTERLIASGDMEYELLDGEKHQHTVLIQNSLVTVSISKEEMKSLYQSHYVEMMKEMDQQLRDKAQKNVELLNEENPYIQEILRQLYYIKDLDTRGVIPEGTTKKFAVTLTESDFDEDHFKEILTLIHLDKFMADIEKRLFDKALLTEGFMPVPMNNTK